MDHYIKREDVEKAIATIRKTYLKAKNFNALSAIDCVAGGIRDEVSNIPVFPINCHQIVDAESILLDNSIYNAIAIYYPDVIIRILDMCGKYGIDIGAMIAEKHEFNKTRPYKHGGKVI